MPSSWRRCAEWRNAAGNNDAKPRDRVAKPAEFARLIDAIFDTTPAEREEGRSRGRDEARKEALPFALAGYGSARYQEIQVLDWEHVDLDVGGGELAGEEEGRKPGGSRRVVPYVKPLWEMLRREWESQGPPTSGKVCPPRAIRQSGLLALNRLQGRVQERWLDHLTANLCWVPAGGTPVAGASSAAGPAAASAS